jgi:hypothetical protein
MAELYVSIESNLLPDARVVEADEPFGISMTDGGPEHAGVTAGAHVACRVGQGRVNRRRLAAPGSITDPVPCATFDRRRRLTQILPKKAERPGTTGLSAARLAARSTRLILNRPPKAQSAN